jgi:hypothetical protein
VRWKHATSRSSPAVRATQTEILDPFVTHPDTRTPGHPDTRSFGAAATHTAVSQRNDHAHQGWLEWNVPDEFGGHPVAPAHFPVTPTTGPERAGVDMGIGRVRPTGTGRICGAPQHARIANFVSVPQRNPLVR